MSVTDVMRRRTPLALSRHGGPEVAGRVARIMAPLLGVGRAADAGVAGRVRARVGAQPAGERGVRWNDGILGLRRVDVSRTISRPRRSGPLSRYSGRGIG